jgi:putative hydrolase of the HAD superfamily
LGLDVLDQAALVSLEKEINEAHLVHSPALTEAWLPEVLAWHESQSRKVAIVSNTGMTPSCILRELLDDAGLLQYVDYELYSDEVGVAKPNEAIFTSLIERSNAFASEILHIGNSMTADYQGARSAGLHALLYDSSDRTSGAVISSHEDVFMHPLLARSRFVTEVG